MRLEAKKLLHDMLESAQAITEFMVGKTLTDLRQDKMFRSATYYQFTILGEGAIAASGV